MRISVCVATKNRTDMLHQLLWSLIRQQHVEWDLVVVDDSDVQTQWNALGVYPRLFREMTRHGHDVRIALGPRVNRIGAAFQVGLTASRPGNPLFFRVDDDAWLEPDYLARLVAIMRDDRVGASSGLFLHPGNEIETLLPHDERYRHATIDGLSDAINIQWYRHATDTLISVQHLTANILFNRGWLEKIGGFETRLFSQHRDETQATWRLHVEGAQLFVHPKAEAWHLRGVTGGARGNSPDVYLEDHRKFMAQRRTMKPGIHLDLGHAIGDGFMATPMLHVMRRMNPSRNIAIYAPWARAVLDGNPDVDEIAEHPLDAQRTARLEQSVYAWASANGWKGHLAEAYCAMFRLPPPEDNTPRYFRSTDGQSREELQGLPDSPYLVIAPWSTARTFDLYRSSGNKNWPIHRWTEIVAWAHSQELAVVQLRGSQEEPLVDGVDIDFCQRPLHVAFAFIERARMVVSLDTMAHHAAAAFGVPSVILWGRSKPEHFGYQKAHIVNLQGACPGRPTPSPRNTDEIDDGQPSGRTRDRPCIGGDQWAMDREVCPLPGHPCMSSISVQSVIEAMEKLISATEGHEDIP